MDNENNIIMSRYAFERMQAKDEKNDLLKNVVPRLEQKLFKHMR